ncbi:MAG TPA: UvrB/UvrC motif-containing protein [Gemmatimonadaceae bacterium]
MAVLLKADAARLAELRQRVRREAEDRPAVYRMVAEQGEVVYVGKSKKLRTRLLSYFRGTYPEDKGARILREAHAIEWSYTPSEFAALLEELRQIKRLRPRMNVALKRDARHYAFVGITRGPAPRLTVLRGTGSRGESTVYGPFTGARRLGEALRTLSDSLGLRDCTHDRRMHFADQAELFDVPPRTPGCIRYEIGTCLGPCVGAPTARLYRDRVTDARAFLEGSDDGPIERLEAAMRVASERLEYERAAALRDRLLRLQELREQFARLRFAVETLSFTYHVPGVDGDDRVYFIRRGVVRHERPAPRGPEDDAEIAALARRIFAGMPAKPTASLPIHEIDELLVVTSWFRTHPGELERTRRWTGRGRGQGKRN